ncbi:MAG: tetratricopeptide repeat protein, partial [Waterburya sp.]
LEKVGDKAKANQAFYQGFSLKPDQITAKNHFLLGNELLEQKQIKLAIACYRRAISQQPDFIDAYWQLGEILIGINKHQEAIACYRQALKVNPRQARSYLLLGKVFYQQQQWQPALACYQKAVELEPNNPDIQHNLGELLAREQQWEQAVVAYRQAIALRPNYSWSHNNLGDVLLKLEQWQASADCYRQAIKLKPDFVWSHYNLGEALVKLAQWEEAASAYQAAQKLNPELPEPRQKLGEVLHQRSKSSQKEALSYYQEQIPQNPDNIELYHQAISLDKQNPQLYLGLGKALFKQEKLDEAIAIYQAGLELQPRNIELAMGFSEAVMAQNPELGWQAVAAKLEKYPVSQGQVELETASKRHLNQKTILIIDLYPPCYDKESGARRLWQLLQIFKQLNFHVIFVPDNGAKEQPYVGMLEDLAIEVLYTEPGYGTPIEQQLTKLLPLVDIAWVCRPQLYEKYAPLIRQYQQIKLIYDTVDLHYLRMQRSLELTEPSIDQMRQWMRMQSRELEAAHD